MAKVYESEDDIEWARFTTSPIIETDDDGQVMLHTCLYKHDDGTIHNAPEEG